MCHTVFCWCCLCVRKLTIEHDNSFHKKECLFWQPPGPSNEDRHRPQCPECQRCGTFCNARPVSSCVRRANGELSDYENTFCACQHDCPCDSAMRVDNACECGGHDAHGNPIPSNDCRCGRQRVTCGTCDRSFCRLCGRAEHVGFKCIEDRLPGDSKPPGEE